MIHTEHLATQGPESMGSKAHGLIRLAGAGFAVPDGYVIGVEALSAWRAGTPPPDPVVSEVEHAIGLLGPGPFAVRSSAVDEDGDVASFAGMYTTTLNVSGVDGVIDAIAAALASQLGAPATAYRGVNPPSMAILIQPMLVPEVAGVAFTADPVTGDGSSVRVAGVRGLGDSVASGTEIPDEWDVTGGVPLRRGDAGPQALNAAQAELVAMTATEIADVFGSPQDVEWAIVDHQVIVLQARPITALPRPPSETLDGVNWQKDTAHCPEPLTPFGWSLADSGERVAAVFARFGLMMNGLESRLVGGEVYVRPVPVMGSPDSTSNPPPAWILGVAARVVPPLRKRMRAAQDAVRAGLQSLPKQWEELERDRFLTRIDELRAVDPAVLQGQAFVDHLDSIRAVLDDGAESHFNIAIPYFVMLHELDSAMQSMLGWSFEQTVALLRSPASRAVSGLDEIRVALASDSRLRSALEQDPSDPVAAIRGLDPHLAGALEKWIDHHGWRTASYDAGSPALIERPGLVTRLLFSTSSEVADGPAREAFATGAASLPSDDRRRLEAVLESAKWIYPMREDNVIIVDNIPSGLARRWLLEAGRRLVQKDLIARSTDAAYLEASEIVAALRASVMDDPAVDLTSIVARRRAEWAWTATHPGPALVGQPTPPPDVSMLPDAGRRLNGALLWAMSHEYPGEERPSSETGVVHGSAGSAGVYRGPVRIVRGEVDFAKIRPGDVLVCPVTTPAWTVLFPLIGAMVTDGGGVLSHAAIVAREHGIPAVLGTRTATTHFTDGQVVEVDGSAGLVRTGW